MRRALLEVANQGRLPWPSAMDLRSAAGAVGVVVRWFPAGSTVGPAAETLLALPHAVYPGDVVVVGVPLLPPSGSTPLPPGDYDIRVGLRQEPNGEFPDSGNPPALPINVPPAPAER
jgi:hypothetical protein